MLEAPALKGGWGGGQGQGLPSAAVRPALSKPCLQWMGKRMAVQCAGLELRNLTLTLSDQPQVSAFLPFPSFLLRDDSRACRAAG